MNRSLKLTTILTLGTMLTCHGCVVVTGSCRWCESPSVWIEETLELEIPLDGVETFAVTAHNGYVHVDGDATGNVAKVTIKKKAGGRDEADAQECMDALRLKSHKSASTHSLAMEWGQRRKSRWSATASYEIHLPESIALRANTHNGGIKVDGRRNACALRTHNGRIELKDVQAEIIATTHNGRIVVQGICPHIQLVTHNGSIEAELAGVGNVTGKIRTHNGSVRLALGDSASAELECRTHNGPISSTLALNDVVVDRHTLQGTLGQGEGRLRVTTHNGSITLTK